MAIKDFIINNPIFLNGFRKVRNFLNGRLAFTKNIKGVGNSLDIDYTAICTGNKIDIVGNNNHIIISDSVVLKNVVFYIRGNNNKIYLSKKVLFNHGGSIWIEDDNGEAIIGENSTFENVHIAVTEPNSKIIIGKDCMFAKDIDIRTGDSHSILDQRTKKRINHAQNVEIGDHVWIASHVSILKGSVVSSNSVVATRAVVAGKFEKENVLLAGIPAKVIKENVNWDRVRIYDN
ncbi:hypothetical protein OIU80_03205 [Flavobacterium sp. LS1R47]|uniref:Acyltransferase n=1 Tax=Flavobacterium frigoritolerans TaxID=2987686 RepID=A0A9X2ZME0_9FLAO|nr:hypothetical protein [Flavobacterium frigoritolerans]MCV9931277.1 hypothetical protein [Flavobacterium frigoritolerans]